MLQNPSLPMEDHGNGCLPTNIGIKKFTSSRHRHLLSSIDNDKHKEIDAYGNPNHQEAIVIRSRGNVFAYGIPSYRVVILCSLLMLVFFIVNKVLLFA